VSVCGVRYVSVCVTVCVFVSVRWMLNLRPVMGTVGSSSVGGKQSIDPQKATWQKGTPLSLRCACSCKTTLTLCVCIRSVQERPCPLCTLWCGHDAVQEQRSTLRRCV
jgi:hypothetical protein